MRRTTARPESEESEQEVVCGEARLGLAEPTCHLEPVRKDYPTPLFITVLIGEGPSQGRIQQNCWQERTFSLTLQCISTLVLYSRSGRILYRPVAVILTFGVGVLAGE